VIGNVGDFAHEGKLAAYFGIVPRVKTQMKPNKGARYNIQVNCICRAPFVMDQKRGYCRLPKSSKNSRTGRRRKEVEDPPISRDRGLLRQRSRALLSQINCER
jgi:hypothetical protein